MLSTSLDIDPRGSGSNPGSSQQNHLVDVDPLNDGPMPQSPYHCGLYSIMCHHIMISPYMGLNQTKLVLNYPITPQTFLADHHVPC